MKYIFTFGAVKQQFEMEVKTKKVSKDISTEEKIKNAARIVFHKKGFSATRTRDIAEEAGINLALLNYYFRSKEKLFDIIVLETMQAFFKSINQVFNDSSTTLESKIETLVVNYIDLLIANPDIPLFILSELKNNHKDLLIKIGMKEAMMKSYFLKQYQEKVKNGKISPMQPLQFMMNLMGMTVFPFIASPVLRNLGDLTQKDFDTLMRERKLLIPKWIKATLKVK